MIPVQPYKEDTLCLDNESADSILQGYFKVVAVGLFFLGLASCLDGTCTNEMIKEIVSPDSKYVAAILKRYCGATTSFGQVVVIRENGSPLRGDDKDEYVFTMDRLLKLPVSWKGAKHLIIEPQDQNAIFIQRDSWRDVKISYEKH
jgi:hypothetical protein